MGNFAASGTAITYVQRDNSGFYPGAADQPHFITCLPFCDIDYIGAGEESQDEMEKQLGRQRDSSFAWAL